MKTQMHCYLENRDPQILPDRFDSWLEPRRTAVVCIDMHGGHLDIDDPECTCPAPRAVPKIDIHNEFHSACRAIGIPIIHCQLWHRYGGVDDGRLKTSEGGPTYQWLRPFYNPPNPHLVRHAWEGTTSVELRIETDERDYYVRTKKRLSCFYPSDLEFLLRNLDVTNIVITGIYTEACDLATAFDAADRDFRVIVPRDIVAGYSEETENFALQIISLWLGLVVESGPLLAEWYARVGVDLPDLRHIPVKQAASSCPPFAATSEPRPSTISILKANLS